MKLPSALRTIVVAAVLGGVQHPLFVLAEHDAATVVYHGVPLEVDERRSAGGDLLKVVLAGTAFLVSESDAPRQVALRYLSSDENSSRLSGAQLQAIALAAARERDDQVLKAVAAVALLQERVKEFEVGDVWQQLAADAETATAVWQGVSGLLDRAPIERVCHASAAVGRVSNDEVAELTVIRPVAERCVQQAIRRALGAIVAGQEAPVVVAELRRESAPFIQHAGALGDEVATLEGVLAAFAQTFEQIDGKHFEASVQVFQAKAEALGMRYDRAPMRHSFIARAVAGKAFRTALEQLSRLPFEERSSKTHLQLVVALRELPTSDWSVLLDPGVRPALRRYLVKDEEIYSQWVSTQRRIILTLVAESTVESAHRLADTVRREEPEIAAQVLSPVAPAIVGGYLDQGNVARAAQVVAEMLPHPPFILRLQLLVAGWGTSLTQLAGIAFSLGLLGLLWRRGRRPASGECADAQGVGLEQSGSVPHEEHRENEARPCGVRGASNEQEPFSAEYVAALQVFGLQPGATLPQIKNAYRSAVKQYHPDLKRDGSQEDTALFIRLTSEYERLLELHEREVADPLR